MAQLSFKHHECGHTDYQPEKTVVGNWLLEVYGVFLEVPMHFLYSWYRLQIEFGLQEVIHAVS